MKKFKLLDLFSGIGGFSLGLERSGYFETVAFCEIEEFPRKVLAKHWPEVPCYHDVRELTAARLASDGIAVDAICGGFPCQDLSTSGTGLGLRGSRSGLWSEYARLIGEIRPSVILVENSPELLSGWLGEILGALAALRYDAEWHCIPASHVGAPHRRDRIWIMAYTSNKGFSCTGVINKPSISFCFPCNSRSENAEFMAYANQPRLEGQRAISSRIESQLNDSGNYGWWNTEPTVGRVANGIPSRVDRLKGLGNAVVPQIPEIIGRAIIDYEGGKL